MRAFAAIALCSLALAGPAGAAERLVTPGPVESVEAGGGWVAWLNAERFTLWHDGESTPWNGPFLQELGTGPDGAPVGLFTKCDNRARDCDVRHAVLPAGPRRPLVDPPWEPRSFDESQGTLLLTLRGRGAPRLIYMWRPGNGLDDTGDLRGGSVSISARAMSNFVGLNGRLRLFGAKRSAAPRWHQLASWDEPREFDGKPGTYRAIGNAGTDGRYVYWVEHTTTYDDHGPVPGSRRTRIVRVEPGAAHRHVEAFTPPRSVFSFAVTHARLYYVEKEDGALYEYRDPPFERTAEELPIRG